MVYENVYDELKAKLNTRGGILQPNTSDDKRGVMFDIRWKGDFHFIVNGWTDYGWYYVQRDKQFISSLYRYWKIDDNTITSMQSLIDDIEKGKFKNKKTKKRKDKRNS